MSPPASHAILLQDTHRNLLPHHAVGSAPVVTHGAGQHYELLPGKQLSSLQKKPEKGCTNTGAQLVLYYLPSHGKHLPKDEHFSNSPAAQSMAAGMAQVVQLPVLCEVLPAAGRRNEARICEDNSNFSLLKMLTWLHLRLFPGAHMGDFISQRCLCLLLKARSPPLERKKEKCPQPIVSLLSRETQTMSVILSHISAEKQFKLFLL